MKKKRKDRKLKKKAFKAKNLSVLIVLVELKEENMINRKKRLKRYYICLKESESYYHLTSKQKITNGMDDKYYNIICIQNISAFTDYMEDGDLTLEQKQESLIDIDEILGLETVLNLVANVD